MKKLIVLIISVIIVIFVFASCGKSDSKKYNIDINKCIDNLKSGLVLEPDYSFVKDYTILAKDKELTISIVVADSTDPEKALDFADTVVRQLNLYAHMQDSNIASSSKDFYGGLYEQYTTIIGVAPLSKIDDQKNWFVFGSVGNGNIKLKLNKKYK